MMTWCLFDNYLVSFEPESKVYNANWDVLRANCPACPRLTGTVVIHRKHNYVGLWEMLHDIPRLMQVRYGDRDTRAYVEHKKASKRALEMTEALTSDASGLRHRESKFAK